MARIIDKVYDTLEDYTMGSDTYEHGAISAITDLFCHYPDVAYQMETTDYPDMTGGICSVAFVDNYENLSLVVFNYIY